MLPAAVRLAIVAVMALAAAPLPADSPPYVVAGSVPDRVDGQLFRTFVFDRAGNRLYAGSDRGLFWIDLAGPGRDSRDVRDFRDVRIRGPMFRKDLRTIEFAEDLGRLFYISDQEVGYVDVRAGGEPVRLRTAMTQALDLAYEPTRHELYVATRAPHLTVFDARSGEFGFRLTVPGWFGHSLEAAPGRVYVHVSPKSSLYAVDAANHRIAPWPVSKGIVTPAYLEADPEGQYLFMVYDRYITAIDAKTATVIGRVVAPRPPSIAFDPGSRLLIATWDDDPPPTRVMVYRVDSSGLTLVSRLSNPRVGIVGVEPTNRGFIQRGTRSLIVWAFQGI
jgi:hypothetical protein